jgi:translation initiation factor 2 alpha subunit (eIF-2alpha)
VVVAEVDTDRGKVILSRRGVTEKEEQEEFNRYKDMVEREDKSSSSLGSLGEKLKAKIEEKKIKKII